MAVLELAPETIFPSVVDQAYVILEPVADPSDSTDTVVAVQVIGAEAMATAAGARF